MAGAQSIASWREKYRTWLMHDALPLWGVAGVDPARGGFEELLGQDGRAVVAPRRARVQARQSFVFARAGRLGWDGPWREIAPRGLEFLERHYRGPDGLYVTLADAGGAVLDPMAMTYDQAFALLAAAELHHHDPDGGWRIYAEGLRMRIFETRAHGKGGFAEGDGRFASNPHMHLLEAALGWIKAGGGEAWRAMAQGIVTLALDRFMEGGVLREFFDADWNIASGDAGQVVEPGHQFEWAWLLERWSRLAGDTRAHDAALLLFAAGERGVNAHGLAVDETDPAMAPRRATARLWPQTERLKAAAILGDGTATAAAAAALWRYLETPKPGLWRDKLREDGSFVEEAAPASSLYHLICAVQALGG